VIPPAALTRSAQIWHPSNPGLPHAATAPVSGARNPILIVSLAARATLGSPALTAVTAVDFRKVRRVRPDLMILEIILFSHVGSAGCAQFMWETNFKPIKEFSLDLNQIPPKSPKFRFGFKKKLTEPMFPNKKINFFLVQKITLPPPNMLSIPEKYLQIIGLLRDQFQK
jgi:hypothetical protein